MLHHVHARDRIRRTGGAARLGRAHSRSRRKERTSPSNDQTHDGRGDPHPGRHSHPPPLERRQMHPESNPESVRGRLERDLHEIREMLTDPQTADLVLEQLPNGEYAWLLPDPDARPYTLTDRGHDALA